MSKEPKEYEVIGVNRAEQGMEGPVMAVLSICLFPPPLLVVLFLLIAGFGSSKLGIAAMFLAWGIAQYFWIKVLYRNVIRKVWLHDGTTDPFRHN